MLALTHMVAVSGLDLVTKATHLDCGTSGRVVGGNGRYCRHMGSKRPRGTHSLIQGRTKQVAVSHFHSSFPGALGQRHAATASYSVASRPLLAAPPFPPPPRAQPHPCLPVPKGQCGGWVDCATSAGVACTYAQWRKGGTGAQPGIEGMVGGGYAERPCPLPRRISSRRLRRTQLRAANQAVSRPSWPPLLVLPPPQESLHPDGGLTPKLLALGWNHFRIRPCVLGHEASWWQSQPTGYRVTGPPTQQA